MRIGWRRITVVLALALSGTSIGTSAEAEGPEDWLISFEQPLEVHGADDVVVTGTVMHQGVPTPGVTVTLDRSINEELGTYQPLGETTTDENGTFTSSLPGVERALTYYYRAKVPGSYTYTAEVEVVRSETPVITLDPVLADVAAGVPFDVTARVSADGPVDGLQLILWGAGTGVVATTDHKGIAHFPVTLTGDGDRTLAPEFRGTFDYYPTWGQERSTRVHRQTTSLSFTAPDGKVGQAVQVSGKLSGDLVGGSYVWITDGSVNGGTSYLTDDQGSFEGSYTYRQGGDLTLTGTFSGTPILVGSSTTRSVTVERLPTTITGSWPSTVEVGEHLPVTGTVEDLDGQGTVELLVDGTSVWSTKVQEGSGGFFQGAWIPASTQVGAVRTVTLRFNGSPASAPSSTSFGLTTVRRTTAIRLTTSPVTYRGARQTLGIDVPDLPDGAVVRVRRPNGTEVDAVVDEGRALAAVRLPEAFAADSATWEVTYGGDARNTADTASLTVPVMAALHVVFDKPYYRPGDVAEVSLPRVSDLPGVGGAPGKVSTTLRIDGPTGTAWRFIQGFPTQKIATGTSKDVSILVVADFLDFRWEHHLPVRLALRTSALRPAEQVGSYAVYRRTTDPRIRTTDATSSQGRCLRTQVQRLGRDDVWRTSSTRPCDRENETGAIAFTWNGPRAAGDRLRFRSYYAQDGRFEPSHSPWAYVRFR